MVKIRLTRGGAKGRPFYHVVVTDQRNKRDGRSLERLGFFNPMAVGGEQRLQLDVAKVQGWVAKGAQLSDKVRVLVKEASRNAA
jgi:small subunit ribosomal protein S16